jgi:polyisoprenyl-phosphate glycosyltransferase
VAASDTSVVYSIVVPVYNEEATLPELQRRLAELLERLDGPGEVVFVDDGSRDSSFSLMAAAAEQDLRFKAVRLSRNFGHQLAITAGLDFASGDAVIVMDADLQDPPEVALELASRWRDGYDVVYAVREARHGETRFKQLTANAFYRLFQRLSDIDVPVDAGDFRLVSRNALEVFRTMRESNRYVRGMFGWIGFSQIGVPYSRAGRFAGSTKYPLRKMVKFAADGIVSFSNAPLRLALQLGFLVSGASFVFGVAALASRLAGLYSVSGLASIAVMMGFLGGIQLLVLGMMGEYIARIHDEVKNRPLYVVRDTRGFAVDVPVVGPSLLAPTVQTLSGVADRK